MIATVPRTVAVVIPTLNEAARIGALLAQVAAQPTELVADILVADGRSADATRAIVAVAAARDPRIRLIDNPDRLQAAGINRAVAATACDTIVRIDAHADYPDDYVPRIVAVFAETGAEMIATRLVTRGVTCLQRGIAAAQNSRAGTGGSAHRIGGRPGFVDHGHHAGIDRAMFDRVGGYDPTFAANEDAELDLRVRRAGGRIWLATGIEVDYQPRSTLPALARQYWKYGQGRARTILKHGERPRARQMLPPVVVVVVVGSLVAAPLLPLLLAVPLLYLLGISAATAELVAAQRSRCSIAAFPALITMHFAWGGGFIATIARRASFGHRNRIPSVEAASLNPAASEAP